jgi:hypothetical protein
VSITTCPKSYITAESEEFLEEVFVRRRFGEWDLNSLSARQIEAFAILEDALRERNDGHHRARATA